ncbi:MAG TPA: hypothetical protein VMS93_05145 [Candidatus Saccharimonadales bacterium]|nr:hypothetical protein [Candidatus Saccharimonadales bacterium]
MRSVWLPKPGLARAAVVAVALLAVSCASPDKLARQSDELLAQGQAQEAYEKARKALDKEPDNEHARQAMTAAAASLMEGWKRDVRALAGSDTVAAARRCIDLDAFRRQLSDYRVGLPPDTAFRRDEREIRSNAAQRYYGRGLDALRGHQPRVAYDAFLAARDLLPGYLDVESLIREAYDRAVTRVAILPFANQTDATGLTLELADRIYSEVARRVTAKDFRFTVLVGRDEIYARVPLDALSEMTRDAALRIGRDLDADCVIYGRVYGLSANSNNETFHTPLERRETVRDESGRSSERYAEDDMAVTLRSRSVSVRYELEALDTGTGKALDRRAEERTAEAHTVYTDYLPAPDYDDYSLYRPEVKQSEPERARALDQSWKDRVGSWSLPELLKHAHDQHDRTAYRPDYRGEFLGHSRGRPVFLGDLPPAGDLAEIALDDLWEPVLSVLKDLEKGP